MDIFLKEDIDKALKIVTLTIKNCEKAYQKFSEGTSQYSLLKNRINALNISKALLIGENIIEKYSTQELIDAVRPISSIISKCKKAQSKFLEESQKYIRVNNIINAMIISKELILKEIDTRNKHF